MAITQLVKNLGFSTLLADITDVQLSLAVQSGHGARFSNPTGSQYFRIVVLDTAGLYEIMKVTVRSTDTFTITRAQEGTTAKAFVAGDQVREILSAQAITDLLTQYSADNSVTDQGYADTLVAAVQAKNKGLLDNLGFTVTLDSPDTGDITIALVQGDGATDCTAAAPAKVAFSGRQTALSLAAAKSLKIDSTDHMGLDFATAVDAGGPDTVFEDFWIYAIDRGGTLEWGVSRKEDYLIADSNFTPTEGQATTRLKVKTTATITANDQCRVVGFFRAKYSQTLNQYTAIESGTAMVHPMPLKHFGRPGRKLLATITLSSDAAAIIDNVITSEWDDYEILLKGVLPATDAANLLLYVSEDNGSTWLAGTTYRLMGIDAYTGASGPLAGTAGSTASITYSQGNVSTAAVAETVNGLLRLIKPADTKLKRVQFSTSYTSNTPVPRETDGHINIETANAYNAVKLAFSAGNIASGIIEVYGIRNSP